MAKQLPIVPIPDDITTNDFIIFRDGQLKRFERWNTDTGVKNAEVEGNSPGGVRASGTSWVEDTSEWDCVGIQRGGKAARPKKPTLSKKLKAAKWLRQWALCTNDADHRSMHLGSCTTLTLTVKEWNAKMRAIAKLLEAE